MAKRSPSSDVEDNNFAEDDCKPAIHKRQRMVVFEPVRLVNVNSVNDLDDKVDRFKLVKLSERLKMQVRMISDKDRTIERLTARQDRDDNTLCMVNRHWNRLDEDLALFRTQLGMEEGSREENEMGNDFLAQIAQMEDDECEKVFDSRVKYTHQLATNVSEAFVRRSEQFAALTKKLKEVANGSKEKVDVSEELMDKLTSLSEENKTLSRLNHKLQSENRDLSLKMKESEDRIALLETKNEEIMRQMDDKDFEIQKGWRREEKLERKLVEMAKERSTKKEKIETNGSHSNHVNHSVKDDDLVKEVEMLKELSTNREQELNEMNEKVASLTAEKEKLIFDLKNLPADVIKETEEYKVIQTYYTFMVEENQRLKEVKDAVQLQMNEMKRHHDDQMKLMEDEEEESRNRLLTSTREIEDRFTKLRKDYEILHIEYEQTVAASGVSGPNAFDYRGTIETLQNQAALVKSDCMKFKQKWKVAVSALNQLQRKTEADRMRMQNYILIPLNEEDIKELSAVDSEEDGGMGGEEGEKGVNGTDRGEKSASVVKMEKEIKMLRAAANELKVSLARVLKKDDRRAMWSEDAQRRISDLEKSLAAVRAELGEKTKEEEGLLNEMEATGQAFEELQETNGKLLTSIKEKEDNNMKAMSDRIYMVHTQNKMKDEKVALEKQVESLSNTIHSLKLELTTVREALKMCNDRQSQLGMHNDKLYGDNERLRRHQIQESKRGAELKIMYEKTSTQLQEAQQAMKSKLSGHVKDEHRIRRLEEEKSILTKRVTRLQRSEVIGSTDAVLMEEIKELKDVLTCPSCKVRRKDGILTKCFHVFCMECLKTRYETRRRKCPKCNAAFGANDFHRVYIG